MIILDKPYVSDFLIETIKKNGFSVLDNDISRKYFEADKLSKSVNINEPFYSNSENSIDWINKNIPQSKLNEYIKISKDKVLFRKKISSVYPDYNFFEVKYDELKNLKNLKFPFVLKPSIGFLSFGVYTVESDVDWQNVFSKIDEDITKLRDVFPKNVVDMTNFIIEDYIKGDEYALDAYFDENSKAVILNIFSHPFKDGKDVSDRLYFTSKKIIQKNLNKFEDALNKIGAALNFKNFPFHLELRVQDNKIIPIEINPLRFCGWCITDIAYYAWKINVYEYYFKKLKPDWNKILDNSDDDYFYFAIGEMPNKSAHPDYEKFKKEFSNPLVLRKIDYKVNPIFAIVFAKTASYDEIDKILKLDMNDFVK